MIAEQIGKVEQRVNYRLSRLEAKVDSLLQVHGKHDGKPGSNVFIRQCVDLEEFLQFDKTLVNAAEVEKLNEVLLKIDKFPNLKILKLFMAPQIIELYNLTGRSSVPASPKLPLKDTNLYSS